MAEGAALFRHTLIIDHKIIFNDAAR